MSALAPAIAPDGTIRRAKGIIEGRAVKLEYTRDLTTIGKTRADRSAASHTRARRPLAMMHANG